MKLYRVSYTTEGGISVGFTWHTSAREAKREAVKYIRFNPPEQAEIERIELRRGRNMLLIFLKAYASHPDNG